MQAQTYQSIRRLSAFYWPFESLDFFLFSAVYQPPSASFYFAALTICLVFIFTGYTSDDIHTTIVILFFFTAHAMIRIQGCGSVTCRPLASPVAPQIFCFLSSWVSLLRTRPRSSSGAPLQTIYRLAPRSSSRLLPSLAISTVVFIMFSGDSSTRHPFVRCTPSQYHFFSNTTSRKPFIFYVQRQNSYVAAVLTSRTASTLHLVAKLNCRFSCVSSYYLCVSSDGYYSTYRFFRGPR